MPPFATYETGAEPIVGYRLVDLLGRGLFGEVWIADELATGRVVAVKLVGLTFSGGSVADFRVLARLTALSHPNLVPVYAARLKDKAGRELDLGQAELARQRGELRELVVVMGLAEKSLAARLQEVNPEGTLGDDRQGLPVEELVRYMEGAARGIDYLNQPDHGAGPGDGPIRHCDVNPRNMLVAGGEVRVGDAGLAALLAPDARRTMVAGTPVYCAPELAANQPGPGTDQYALAVSYYELRTGRLPFDDGMGHASIILAHAEGRLDFSAPGLTESEREVLKRATAVHPEDRYPSCVKLVRELSRAVEKLFPDRTVRTLRDSQGLPYPSPLRPDSYWRAVLLPGSEAKPTALPADAPPPAAEHPPGEPAAPPEPVAADGTAVPPELPAPAPIGAEQPDPEARPPQPPPPAPEPVGPPQPGLRLSVSAVRATPILLPLEDPPPRSGLAAVAGPTAVPAARETPNLPLRRGPLIPNQSPPQPSEPAPAAPPPKPVPPPPAVLPPPPPAAAVPARPVPPPPPIPPERRTDTPVEPPAWYREAQEAETLANDSVTRSVGAAPRPPAPADRAAVRYYARMRPARVFPLDVAVFARPGGPVEVEPILPGCDCHPPRETAPTDPAGEPAQVTFWVVPHVLGRVRGARVVVRRGGRVLAEVPLDVRVSAPTWAWAAAGAGLVVPYALIGLRSLRPAPARAADEAGVYRAVGEWVLSALRPDWVGLALLGLAVVLFLWLRPQRRETAGGTD